MTFPSPAATRLCHTDFLAPRHSGGPGTHRHVTGYGDPTHRARRAVGGEGGGAVSATRRERLLALLAAHDGAFDLLKRVCELCVTELSVTGARVRMLGNVDTRGGGVLAYATDTLGATLDDLANTVGTGPCIDAFDSGLPVMVPDLVAERVRWPGFTSGAATAGVAAVFSFPLRVGAVRLGVLELHRTGPGPLSATELVDAFVLADAATNAIFDDLNALAPMTLPGVVDIQAEVHQATGFVAVDLKISLQEALMRIRGYAFAHQTPLAEVAKNIIERRLRLESGE